jgi:hypothetical protein
VTAAAGFAFVFVVCVVAVVMPCLRAAAEADRNYPSPPVDTAPPALPAAPDRQAQGDTRPLSSFGGADVVAAAEQFLQENP